MKHWSNDFKTFIARLWGNRSGGLKLVSSMELQSDILLESNCVKLREMIRDKAEWLIKLKKDGKNVERQEADLTSLYFLLNNIEQFRKEHKETLQKLTKAYQSEIQRLERNLFDTVQHYRLLDELYCLTAENVRIATETLEYELTAPKKHAA